MKAYTIGRLIDELSMMPMDAYVRYDFCGMMPYGVHSDRGLYSHAALGHKGPAYWCGPGGLKLEEFPTVATLIELLKTSMKYPHTGWKGGEYQFDKDTPIHIDNYGEYTHTQISSVEKTGLKEVIIHTCRNEDVYDD